MALTFKLLGIGTLTSTSAADIVPIVTTGKSVLVDNLVLYNRGGASVTVNVEFVRLSPSKTVRMYSGNLGPSSRVVLEAITLTKDDKLQGLLSAAGTVDFAANGVVKDV